MCRFAAPFSIGADDSHTDQNSEQRIQITVDIANRDDPGMASGHIGYRHRIPCTDSASVIVMIPL
jgi:hypothetical protein